jgi:peptidyl-prolyl cis-trans isomerase A (cyclophilin A)
MVPRVPKAAFLTALLVLCTFGTALRTMPLEPVEQIGASGTAVRAPDRFVVRLETTKGAIVIECVRAWAPNGADRFYELVTSGYFDDAALFRIRPKTWVQFGINGDPKVAQSWRSRTIADDPFQPEHTNLRGTVFFAWAVANGRTTQVVINLKDNREVHDKEPFVPFGRVVQGMEVADALFDEYGETAGGGIRAGKQDPVFEGGNAYLKKNFPKLDYIKTARVITAR